MKAMRSLVVALGLLASAGVHAEDATCAPDDTVTTCVRRLVFDYSRTLREGAPAAADASPEAVANSASNSAEENSQPGAATASQTASGVTDLLPWLNMLGLLSDSDESDGTVAFDLNFLLMRNRDEEARHDSQLKWQLNVSPTLFEPLAQAIPEDVRDERTKALQDDIDETADSTLEYTYSVINKHLGRDFRQHQKEFQALIAPRIFSASRGASSADITAAFAAKQAAFGAQVVRLAGELNLPEGVAPGTDKSKLPIRQFSTDEQARINELVRSARNEYAQEMANRLDAMQRAVSDPRIYRIAELVLQQPQVLVTANKAIRNELVGPESWGVKVTYEKSFIDFNSFRKFARSGDRCAILDRSTALDAPEALAATDTCLTALDSYLDKYAEQIDNDSRWSASLEYKQIEDWSYALPADGVDLSLPKHDRLVASASFGRAIQRSSAKDRVDLQADYDSNMGDDETYNSRFVVTLTYTRRFMDMDMPLSIVYANKSEFLGDTDKQIGLHIGIKYRALDKEK